MSAASTEGLSPEAMREAIATLSSPDRVESPFGALDFFDGVPTPDTVTTIYDALDLMRGIEVFLNGLPGASLVAMRRGLRSIGITSPQVIGYTDPRANSGALFLTPNTETTYGTTFLDLRAWGPTVIPAAGLRRRGPGRLLHLPVPDVRQLGDPASARRCPGDQGHQDLPARSGRQPGRERLHQHRGTGVQHHPRQQLLLLRGARRAHPGGAHRGARRRTGRPARGDRHRQGPTVRTG
jgi:hypothetical protein